LQVLKNNIKEQLNKTHNY